MAEQKPAAESPGAGATAGGQPQKPILFIILAVVNMLIVAGVGFMIYAGKKKEAAKPTLDQVLAGEKETSEKEGSERKDFVGKVIALETFMVNLAESKGRRVAKVNMEIEIKDNEVEGKVTAEIEQRKAQIRDIIIIILSSKTYEQVSTNEGKDNLRNQIKDTINSFLTTGRIQNVYFTEFIYN